MWAGQSNNQSAPEEVSLPEVPEPRLPVFGRSSGAAAARGAVGSGQRRLGVGVAWEPPDPRPSRTVPPNAARWAFPAPGPRGWMQVPPPPGARLASARCRFGFTFVSASSISPALVLRPHRPWRLPGRARACPAARGRRRVCEGAARPTRRAGSARRGVPGPDAGGRGRSGVGEARGWRGAGLRRPGTGSGEGSAGRGWKSE